MTLSEYPLPPSQLHTGQCFLSEENSCYLIMILKHVMKIENEDYFRNIVLNYYPDLCDWEVFSGSPCSIHIIICKCPGESLKTVIQVFQKVILQT